MRGIICSVFEYPGVCAPRIRVVVRTYAMIKVGGIYSLVYNAFGASSSRARFVCRVVIVLGEP